MTENEIDENRVLVLAASRRELDLTTALLRRGEVQSHSSESIADLIVALDRGAGCIVITDDVLAHPAFAELVERLAAQPTWSELPFIVLVRTEASADTVASTLGPVTLTTVLERPVRVRTLASAVGAALRARTRQYELRRHLEDLQAAWTDVDLANRAKDEFLAVLAHELRNPLAPIRTAVQFLSLEKSIDPARRKAHEMINRQLGHLVRLVDDLLDVSRVALGRIQVKCAVVTLQDALSDAVEAARPLIEVSRHTLLVDVPAAPIYLDGDITRLVQVFQNLLNNAARYTPPDGTISLGVTLDASIATIRVIDNGIGIRSEMLDELFQPFVHGSHSLVRAQGGLGVGLALAYKLVELHNGTLRVESEGDGCGSEFIVKLPLSFRTPKETPMQTADESASTGKGEQSMPHSLCRVLVVDDNVDAAESLSMLLELEGADVKQAHNGYDALAIAQNFAADVIVLDIGMPGLDGYAVCRQLRATPNGKDLRIVALTGWGQQEDRRKTQEAGFDAHLVKPVDPAQLTQILSDVVSGRGASARVAAAAGAAL